MFTVKVYVFISDTATSYTIEGGTHSNLHKALRAARECVDGIPEAFALITRGPLGIEAASMECDWRGEVKEAAVYSRKRGFGVTLVTPMNPNGRMFANVFA